MRLIWCPKCKTSNPFRHKRPDKSFLCEKREKRYYVICDLITETPDKNGDIIKARGVKIPRYKRKHKGIFKKQKSIPIRINFLKNHQAHVTNTTPFKFKNKWVASFIVNNPLSLPKEIIKKMYPAVGGKVKETSKNNPKIITKFQLREIGLSFNPNYNPDIMPCRVVSKSEFDSFNWKHTSFFKKLFWKLKCLNILKKKLT